MQQSLGHIRCRAGIKRECSLFRTSKPFDLFKGNPAHLKLLELSLDNIIEIADKT